MEVQGFARQQDAELHAFAQNGNRVIDCQLIGTRRPFDVDHWESEVLTHSADPSELYVQYIGRLKKRVAARGAANPAAYLAVKLGSLKGGGVSALDAAPLPSQVPIDGSGQQTLLALAAGKLLNVSEETWGSPRTVDIEGGLPGGPAERMFMWRLQEDHSRRSTGLRPLIG